MVIFTKNVLRIYPVRLTTIRYFAPRVTVFALQIAESCRTYLSLENLTPPPLHERLLRTPKPRLMEVVGGYIGDFLLPSEVSKGVRSPRRFCEAELRLR